MGRIVLGVLSVLVVAACASGGGRSRCEAVPQEFLAGGVAYRDCDVNVQAELMTPPRIDAPVRLEGAGCMTAWFEYVVDTAGHVVQSSAKLVRTNNKPWADYIQSQLSEVRYRPAEKDGRRVPQLVRFRPTLSRSSGGYATANRRSC